MVSKSSGSLAYTLRFAPKWFRISLRTYWQSNKNFRRAIRGITNARLRYFFQGKGKFPSTLQIIHSIGCVGSCDGCLYTDFQEKDKTLSLDNLEMILIDGKDIGVSTVYMLGADIFYGRDSMAMLELMARHKEILFLLFTNGVALNEQHIQRIYQAGNILTLFSLDGLQSHTDGRKGEGCFANIEKAIISFGQKGVPFGISTMVSDENWDDVVSVDYLKQLEQWGAFFVVYIPYSNPGEAYRILSLEEGRWESLFPWTMKMGRLIKNMIVLDMLGIEENLTGCPAGKDLISVYHDGTVTPCFALPFGDPQSSIYSRSLREIISRDDFIQTIHRLRRGKPPLKCLFKNPHAINTFYKQRNLHILSPGNMKKSLMDRNL